MEKTSSGPLIGGIRKENTFQAMLAVSGKQAVVHYYNIFKEKAPHLNVTMTFSTDESNKNGTKEQNEALKKQLRLTQKNSMYQVFFLRKTQHVRI